MPIAVGRNSPNSYRIESITITNNEGNSYEVSNLMQSFQITESIYQMFITGSMTFTDSMNIFNKIGFTGQEYIRIHIGGIQGYESIVPHEQRIDQVFRIFNVSNHVRSIENPVLQIYRVEFCSPLLYLARTQRISQAFRGKTGDILNKICFDKLNFQEKPIKKTGQAKRTEPRVKGGQALGNFFSVFESGVGDVNGMIIPNWSVFKTLRWLRDNTSDNTEEWGDSYYFYQTCMDGFKFHSIESMRKIEYLGGQITFAPRMSGGDENFNYDVKDGVGNDILAYNKSNTYNVLDSHLHGTYGGNIQVFDPKTKLLMTIPSQFEQQFPIVDSGDKKGQYKNKKKHFAVAPSFRFGAENIKIPPDGGIAGEEMPPIDADIPMDGITEATGAAVSFNYNNPYTFSQGVNVSGHSVSYATEVNKFNRERAEKLLENNRMNIQISGRTNISAGQTINIQLLQPTPTTEAREELTHNGRMLVEGITWIGTEDGLETQLTVATDGHQVNMDTFFNHEGSQQY